MSAVNISSFAIASPTIQGRVWVPPAPGNIAREVSGNPIIAYSVDTQISEERASSIPPPRVAPSTRAIVGQDIVENSWKTLHNFLTKLTASS